MSDFAKLEVLILDLSKSVKGLESEMGSMKSEMGSMKSEMGSMKSEMGSMKSEMGSLRSDMTSEIGSLRSEMGSMKSDMNARFDRLEIWNDKAFGAIEDLRTEVRSDGAATRGMIYEAYDQVADIKDTLATQSTPSIIRTRYPRVTTKR